MNDFLNFDRQHVWHPFTPLLQGDDPILITSGKGVFLHTHDGKKIMDAVSSWWVNLHGHAHPHLAKAIAEQASVLEHVIFAGFTHEPAIKLAQNLLTILPDNQSRIFFSDNGSTAVEVALKMAFQFWYNQGITKRKVIALDGAYHGDTFGSMSVGERGLFTDPFKPYLFDTLFLDFPHPGNEEKVLRQFDALISHGDVGAFIYEPLVQGAAGMRMYSAAVLDALLEKAKAHNIVCIADEVFVGFGRTGKLFASHYCKGLPDIVAVSKGITGGMMPLGVTSCSEEISSAYQSDDFQKTFFHGHSYTANPLACAVANASFELLMARECQQSIQAISASHSLFKQRIESHPALKEVRSRGTILALELKTIEETAYSNTIRKKIYPFFLERNILLRPLGNVMYVLPPYVIAPHQLEEVYNAIEEFLNSL